MHNLLLVVLCWFACSCFGGTYWVSPNGAATFANAQSATPLSGTACTSLWNAGVGAVVGDLVFLRDGTYDGLLRPVNSGSTNNPIVFKSYTNETAIISNGTRVYGTYFYGLLLNSVSWIRVENIIFERNNAATAQSRLLYIIGQSATASYNEIANCVFDGKHGYAVLMMWDGISTPHPGGSPATHNWIHGCTFKNTGSVSWTGSYVNDDGGFQLGVPSYDSDSNYNTIEDCTFYGGGHHNLETFTKYNVIRNNFFHFEGSITNNTGHPAINGPDENGLYGNRNIQIYDGYNSDGTFNLLEGNRFGTSGAPPDDDGGDSLTITSPKNIIRYNFIYNSQNNGVLFKVGGGSYSHTNRFYNNTIFKSGRFRNTNALWQGALIRWYGSYTNYGTIVKNNILFRYGGAAEITGGPSGDPAIYGTILTNNWLTALGDPLFADTNITDVTVSTQPNLALTPSSGAIDASIALTLASGSGTGSTTLVVDDALYFQDGTWGSALAGHRADVIAVGRKESRAQIVSIDYASNTITLASALTWSDDAPVYLYARNDGTVVWSGSAPDIGAYEYTPTARKATIGRATLGRGTF